MIVIKNYFVSTTPEIDFIPILHDVRFAIRDSQLADGLLNIHLPDHETFLWIVPEDDAKNLRTTFNPNDPRLTNFLSLPFQKKEILLSPKQMIYLIDPTSTQKRREFFVTLMGDAPQPTQAPGRPGARPQGGKR